MSRRIGRIVGLGALGLLSSACVVREDPKEIARCKDVDASVVETLARSITNGELRLRRVQQVASKDQPGVLFVSGEIVDREDGNKDEGDIATWRMTSTAGAGLVALDEHARDFSAIPADAADQHSYIDIDGYVTSRGCVDHLRPPRPLELK